MTSFVIVQLPWKRDMDTQQTYKKVIRGENEQLLTVSASETTVGGVESHHDSPSGGPGL